MQHLAGKRVEVLRPQGIVVDDVEVRGIAIGDKQCAVGCNLDIADGVRGTVGGQAVSPGREVLAGVPDRRAENGHG
jgi:hypothetical protein